MMLVEFGEIETGKCVLADLPEGIDVDWHCKFCHRTLVPEDHPHTCIQKWSNAETHWFEAKYK